MEGSTKRFDAPVVGLGLVNKDFVAVVPAWDRDAKTTATAWLEQVGGPVPVALTAIARLGAPPVSFLGVVGEDRDGQDVLAALAAQGVDHQHALRAANAATSRSLVLIDARDGARSVANWSAGLPPLPAFTPEQESLLRRARLLHLDGRDLDAALRAARIVRESGGMVSLDLGTMRPGVGDLLPLCDIVIASRRGGSGAFPNAESPGEQVQGFLALGASVAGVTLGEEGVVIGERDGNTPIHLPAFPVSPVVDTCGAGDAFHGAFLWAHLTGMGWTEAANFAQAAVAVRIKRLGNLAGLPTRAEVEARLAASGRL